MKTKFNGILTLLLALVVQFTFAQEKTISGTVSDDSGPLPGVNVIVKGTASGTQSDFDGKYTVKANTGDVLVFSFVGMSSVERTVGNSDTINVTLATDNLLEEIVVLGYTTRGKNEVTGAAVQIDASEVNQVPVVSVDQALQGKVAGLAISQSSGTPGSTQDIRIRGVGSISAGNSPLYVIDGVPVVNSNFSGSSARSSLSALATINSNDIQSITVLKDASATAAYGARGSNGVIVITTKTGKSGKTKFTFNTSIGVRNDATEGRNALTGDQRAELYTEAAYNTYGEAYGFTEAEALEWMTGVGLDWWDLAGWDGNSTNWGDEVKVKDALVTNFDLSAQGGNEKSSFYASLGYNKTEATVIGSDFERITAKFNYKRDLTDNLKFSTNMSVSNTFQNIFLEQSAYFANPYLSKYFASPWESPYNDDGSYNLDTSTFNTLYLAENDIQTNDLTRAINNSFLEWEIIDNLKIKSLFSIDYVISNYQSYQNRYHGGSVDEGGSAEESTLRNFNWVFQNSIDYSFTINEDHNFAVKALMEYQKNKENYLYAYGENFSDDGLIYLSSASANLDASSSFYDWMNTSYLGMINYNYAGKYIVDLTYRREGSSRFAEGNRFGDFGSVGVAWNLHEEDFLASNDLINSLRIRASYGLSGSSSIDLNSYQSFLSYDADYADNGAVYPSQYGNSDLTWEKNKTFDLGLEFGILDDKISGSVAYYNKETYDLLQDVPFTLTSGHDEITMNAGTVVNKGIEAMLNVDIFRTEDFNWSMSANLATVDNEVTQLANDGNGDDINIETGTRIVQVGEPIYAWNMRKYAGVDSSNGLPQWYINGKDGEVTNDYYEAEKALQGGSAIPTYTGGLSTHIDYKGFFVDASIYFAGGHKVFEDWSFYTHHTGYYTYGLYNGVEQLMDRWQQAGDETDVPLVVWDGTGNNASRSSTRFLYDGDYIRMKDLVFGYNLPQSALDAVGFDGATITLRGTNLFTWVKDDKMKYDPEVRADGFTRLTTPAVKSFVIGLNLKF